MGHFDTVRPNGLWGNESVPTQADFQRWDVTQSAAVNGDLGGLYAPTAPIIIGGQGMSLGGSSSIVGGVTTALGGGVIAGAGVFDYPRLQTTRSRLITLPFVPMADEGDQPFSSSNSYFPIPNRYLHDRAMFGTITLWFQFTQKPTSITTTSPPYVTLTTYRYDGSTVDVTAPGELNPTSSTVVWTATRAYTVGQYVLPSSIGKQNGHYFKCTVAGTAQNPEPTWPTTNGSTVTDGGGVQWTCTGRSGSLAIAGATPDSLFFNGQPQPMVLDLDTTVLSPNTIDLTTHHYVVKLVNLPVVANPLLPQQSTVYGTRMLSCNLNIVTIGDMRPP